MTEQRRVEVMVRVTGPVSGLVALAVEDLADQLRDLAEQQRFDWRVAELMGEANELEQVAEAFMGGS